MAEASFQAASPLRAWALVSCCRPDVFRPAVQPDTSNTGVGGNAQQQDQQGQQQQQQAAGASRLLGLFSRSAANISQQLPQGLAGDAAAPTGDAGGASSGSCDFWSSGCRDLMRQQWRSVLALLVTNRIPGTAS